MKNKSLAFSFIAIVTTVAILFSACRRINESTDIGGGLIPPIDNINTFDTLISVQTFNDTFGLANDSVWIRPTDEFFLGRINSDPFFGATNAKLFLELKPALFPFAFPNKKDSLFIDSVVLVLDYAETYGDTAVPQTINVYELDQAPINNIFRADTLLLLRSNPLVYSGPPLGSRTFIPTTLKDSVKAFGDTTNHQLRIRLNDAFGQRLLNYDSISNTINGAYTSDSVFKKRFRGFALESANTGNAVMGFNLAGANTKLAIYYKYYKNFPNIDTTVTNFVFGSLNASASYVTRDYSGTPLLASLNNGPFPDPVVYLQNNPGTFAMVKLPELAQVSNRVVHRAELIIEQLYDVSDSLFRAPDYLYLDASDPSITSGVKFRTIPYDLLPENSGGFNLGNFGVAPLITTDLAGNRIRVWKFNLSRYVQNVLTGTQSIFDLRLYPAFRTFSKFGIPPGVDVPTGEITVNPAPVKGRIRVGGGNHPTQKMRLRIIYSKL